MLRTLGKLTLIGCLGLLVAANLGQSCAPTPQTGGGGGDGGGDGGGGGGDGGGGGTTTLSIVKTNIEVRHDAGLRCGDDLIAFGTGAVTGVSYIIPSAGDTSARIIPNDENFNSSDFAVAYRSICLADGDFGVTVYDTESLTEAALPLSDIFLKNIPVSADDVGNIQADGNYCVTINRPSTIPGDGVDDGKYVKVLDCSEAPPAVIAFENPPDISYSQVQQVAVDAATKRVVAVAGSSSNRAFYVYDIDNPTASPTVIAAPNGVGDDQIQISGNYLIALDDEAYEQAFLVNLSTGSVITLTDAEATGNPAIGGSVFAFFADADAADSHGGHQRTAVGTVPGPGSTKAGLDDYIDGSTGNNGLVGFADSMTVTPDGGYVFLADWYLQYSTSGASFVVPVDPGGTDPYACPAWDVHSSDGLVGFKTAADRSDSSDTTLGYIVLP